MVNCNPETVSTDYDTSDRLYFEPLTAEDVLEIVRVEASAGELCGVIVQLGGQTPLKLAQPLAAAGVPILGTSPDAIDLAEDRERFQKLLRRLRLRQPANDICFDPEEALAKAERHRLSGGDPAVLRARRPRHAHRARAERARRSSSAEAARLSDLGPILIDGYLEDAIEVDVDVVADGESVFVAGIMEHIEEAGIHSGDSACSLPPHSLAPDMHRRDPPPGRGPGAGARGARPDERADGDQGRRGLHPRGQPARLAHGAVRRQGDRLADRQDRGAGHGGRAAGRLRAAERGRSRHVAVKEAVFPFARFPGVDLLLGPEMKSTGEVMGLDRDFGAAFAKSQLGVGNLLPDEGTVFISVRDRDKPAMVELGRLLLRARLSADRDRRHGGHLRRGGLEVEVINKVHQGRPHIVDRIKDGGIAMVLNTTEGQQAIRDSYTLRRAALVHKVPVLHDGRRRARGGPGDDRLVRRTTLRSRPCNPIINALFPLGLERRAGTKSRAGYHV